ncbi:hypothetical protein LARV_02924 [Longilinea arvoryzae]|uniref:Histidine kinase N-terminal 7TM region domain-containing protein n=1 Tax=Longilinea arvoryzae TaxID=360412 RepID=A0A0S7BBQ9_9CHLR|nr:histidine kinase N-terminal 7TM domain-containing protein [Longilinea arvoryzae]GAP15143.1 hypothetical protein LARV_02924 [Longilinea arvoryzae]
MGITWQDSLLLILKTTSQILTAGIAITAFSLLLYALTFNLRDQVARSFAVIMLCVVIIFTSEAISSISTQIAVLDFWGRVEWVGIVLLPPSYLQFSDTVLSTTGKVSRWRRRWAVRLTFLASLVFLAALPFPSIFGYLVTDRPPAPHFTISFLTDLFTIFYLVVMALAWFTFMRALRRTVTPTSRRRMIYLLFGAAAPALGGFPYLLYGSEIAAQHPLLFWSVSVLTSLLVGTLIIVMAYAVAFFGVSWPDRVVRARLFKWIMRGPVTASFTLTFATLVRRAGEMYGNATYTAAVPIVMVGTVLLFEHLITVFGPLAERFLFYGRDSESMELLHLLQDRMLSRDDLRQFLETVLAAVCDQLQAPGAYLASLNGDQMELVVTIGKTRFEGKQVSNALSALMAQKEDFPQLFQWGDDLLVPITNGEEEGKFQLLGLLGVSQMAKLPADEEQSAALTLLTERAKLALRDWHLQEQVFKSLESLSPQVEYIQRLRAAGSYDQSNVLEESSNLNGDLTQWVRDALTHYWGGPKLTDSPLANLRVVKDAIENHEGSTANGVRAILRAAIERNRPEGERRFTGEWILYNILDMKFVEGKKVREIASRLSMSEADLYRKQRIAIEAVARTIQDMEQETYHESLDH